MRTTATRATGFTLIEIVVVLAVLAILAAAITPPLLRQLVDARIATSRSNARVIYEAMTGTSDVKGSYGFLGDMGRLPVRPDELIRPPVGTPVYNGARTFRSVGVGWRGPYLAAGENSGGVRVDPWGRPYRITPTGQVRCAGPDGVYDSEDDIVYPPDPPRLGSRVLVTVKQQDAGGEGSTIDPAGYQVRLYYSNNGQEAFLSAALAPFAFENVHPGVHAIAVVRTSSNQIVAQDTIEVAPNSTRLVHLFFRP
jgi:general secretion pathway protein G